jgi:hypothetical protein
MARQLQEPPIRNTVLDINGNIDRNWAQWFRDVSNIINELNTTVEELKDIHGL